MRRILLIALTAVAGCGGTTMPEPWRPPSGALDLNAAPCAIGVYAKQAVFNDLQGKPIDSLEVAASMSATGGLDYAPTVKLPTESRPLIVDPLRTGVQEETSDQNTERVVLSVYARGTLTVQVTARANGEVVAIGCSDPEDVTKCATKATRVVLESTRVSCL